MSIALNTMTEMSHFNSGATSSKAEEARKRISTARELDVAFVLKRRLGSQFPPEDVRMLVDAVLQSLDVHNEISREFIHSYLKSRGRSNDKTVFLVKSLFGY